MKASVVVELQVAEQSLPELGICVEALAVQVLGLHGVEKRFHVGVVVHARWAIHALDDAVLAERSAVVQCGVFDAPLGKRVVQRSGGQRGLSAARLSSSR